MGALEPLARLAAVPFFATLERQELERLATQVAVVTAEPGDVLLREGALGDRMYVIEAGAPRVAGVHAVEALETVSLDGEWFRAARQQTPALRSLMASLSSMYLLPRRGVVTLQTGQVDGRPSVTAVYALTDGRRVVTTRLAERAAFTSQVLGATGARSVVRFEDTARGVFRELGMAGGRLVQLDAEGEWTQLGDMLGRLLDGTPVEEWQLALFRERGNFSAEDVQPLYEDREVICTCTHTTCGRLLQAINEEHCHTLDAVAQRTNVTRVCGGCAPLVKELLGRSEWTRRAWWRRCR